MQPTASRLRTVGTALVTMSAVVFSSRNAAVADTQIDSAKPVEAVQVQTQPDANSNPSAPAQETVIEAPKVEVLGTYETGVGTTDSASAGTVTSTRIESRPLTRDGEVLETVPGMIVTQHSGSGKANQYFTRGFNLDHGTDFSTWVAGMPVNLPTHAHGQGYMDLNFMIPELISRVDYRKGPYSAEDGDFSAAGSAHIDYFDKLPQNIVSTTAGSYEYGRTLLAGSPELGGGRFLYGLEFEHVNGPWEVPENFQKYNMVGRYSSGDADHGFSLTGMAYHGQWTATDQIARRAVDEGLIDLYGTLNPTDGGYTERESLSWQSHDDFGSGETLVDAYVVRYRLNLFSDFTYFLNDPVHGDQFEQVDRRVYYGAHPRLVLTDTWFGMPVINKIGIQLRRDNIAEVGLFNTQARQVLSTVQDDSVRESSEGFYFENTIQWLEKFRSVQGIRTDYYQFNVDSSIAANSGSASANITSPKLSLIFGPWAGTEYFINYGEGFHSNDGRGTTLEVDPTTLQPAQRVTPLVKARGSEIGIRTEAVPNLQSSVAVWQLSLASELVFDGDTTSSVPSGPTYRKGIEWSNHYRITPWWFFDLDLGATRARFTDNEPAGNYVPEAINKYGHAAFTVTQYGPWSGAVEVRYFGPRALTQDGSVTSASTTLVYLRAGYKFDDHWKASLDIYNLFNRKDHEIDYFYVSRLPGEPAAGVDDLHFHPVEPIAVRLTATYSY